MNSTGTDLGWQVGFRYGVLAREEVRTSTSSSVSRMVQGAAHRSVTAVEGACGAASAAYSEPHQRPAAGLGHLFLSTLDACVDGCL
jgi:hypothetical protein